MSARPRRARQNSRAAIRRRLARRLRTLTAADLLVMDCMVASYIKGSSLKGGVR